VSEAPDIAWAVLLAGGSGQRLRVLTEEKILVPLGGEPLFVHSVRAFAVSGVVAGFVVVYRDEAQRGQLQAALDKVDFVLPPLRWVQGGAERQDSVSAGIAALPDECGVVFIHDGARPFLQADAIRELAQAVARDGAAVLARKVTDTIKAVSPGTKPWPEAAGALLDQDRSRLWAMETPQAFRVPLIEEAYARIQEKGLKITDDTAAVGALGVPVALVETAHPNPKLTVPSDLPWFEFLWNNRRLG
jgi:2-C-methyl-D-erythritol 4-phosphate cytidylyltransferase